MPTTIPEKFDDVRERAIEIAEPGDSDSSSLIHGQYTEFEFITSQLNDFENCYNSINGPDPKADDWWEYFTGEAASKVVFDPSWQNEIDTNICAPLIETQVGLITADSQYARNRGRNATEDIWASFRSAAVNQILTTYNQYQRMRVNWVRMAKIFDTGWIKVYFDEHAKRTRIELRDPRNIAFDPGAMRGDLADCESFYEFAVKPIEYVLKRYPRAAEELSLADKPSSGSGVRGNKAAGSLGIDSTHSAPWVEEVIGYGFDRRKYVALLECYNAVYENDGKTRKIYRTLIARNIILEGPDLVEEGVIPYVPQPNVVGENLTSQVKGISDIKLIYTIQDEINRTMTRMSAIAEFVGNPRVVVVNDSIIYENVHEYNNAPGEIFSVNSINDIRFESGDGIHGANFEYVKLLIERAESILGIFDVSQGRRAKNIVAGKAIANLQEAGKTRPRMFLDVHNECFVVLVRKIMHCIRQNHDFDDVVAIAGYEGRKLRDLVTTLFGGEGSLQDSMNKAQAEIHKGLLDISRAPKPIIEYAGESGPTIPTETGEPLELDTGNKKIYYFKYRGKELFKELDDEILVEATTYLPDDKEAKADIYMNLANMHDKEGDPAVDFEALLDALGIPDRKEIRERIQAKKNLDGQMQQMQQMLQQQGQQIGELEKMLQDQQQKANEAVANLQNTIREVTAQRDKVSNAYARHLEKMSGAPLNNIGQSRDSASPLRATP